jgi:ubiquinone/menaquinone biosynthesis C-methylase UbiE
MPTPVEKLNLKMFASASKYLEKSRGEFDRSYFDFIKRSINISSPSVILDVGCGIGFLTQTIKKIFPKAVTKGIDVSPELIEIARKRFGELCEFQVGNAYDLPVESNACDLTVCQTLLIHLSRPGAALHQMIRVTKPGGQILSIEPIVHSDGKGSFVPGKASIKKLQRDKMFLFDFLKKAEGHIDIHLAPKLPAMFLEKRLEDVNIDSFNQTTFHTDSKSEDTTEVAIDSYHEMLISLGYPQAEIEELLRNEQRYKTVRGEFNIITMLAVSGIKRHA